MADSSSAFDHQEDTNGFGKEVELSVPRGGPIYVENLMSPLTNVSLYQTSILQQLQNLEVELSSDSLLCDQDISVDELKITTSEEELVDMAIKEVLQDSEGIAQDLETSNDRTCTNKSRKRKVTQDNEAAPTLSSTPTDPSYETTPDNPDASRKRKAHAKKNNKKAFWSQIAKKVEHFKQIKEKQEEDKAAVTLHSFNPSLKNKGAAIASSSTCERMKPFRSASSAVVKVKPSSIQRSIPVYHPEVALFIEVYHNMRNWIKTQEFMVLGQQSLTELKDKIYCLTDQLMQNDGKKSHSGYFLIENTFYNDLRDPSAIDYSEPIFDWLRNSRDDALQRWECVLAGKMPKKKKTVLGNVTGSQLPHLRSAKMHEAQFCDLTLQLGAGYLYCHQGDCRHTIVIRDMRLLHPEDIQNRAAYPILLFQLKLRVQKCKVCGIYRATKMTVNDKWAPHNPCYFCDNCYFLLHYKDDGSLQYQDYNVYDYHHDQPQ